MTRRLAVLLAVAVAAAACADDDAGTTTTTTVAATTTATAATTTTRPAPPGIPVDPDVVPDGDPDLLAALVWFPDEVPPPYDALDLDPFESGYAPAGGSLASALDASDEADDIVRFGQVAEFTTAYGDPDVLGVAFNGTQFATPEGADAYLEDWVEDLRLGAGAPGDRFTLQDFRAEHLDGLGDQAIRVGYDGHILLNDGTEVVRPGGAIAVRSGALVLWVWGNGPDAEQVIDDFTAPAADRVAAVASGEIAPRDHTALGLSDPPTLALDSFAFTYEHGIDALADGFAVEVTGVFEGPDRASCRTAVAVTGLEPVESYLVAAGTRVWLGDITGYEEIQLRDPAALSALTGCPAHPIHWEITKLHRLEVSGGEEVTVSGVPALRVDLAGDPGALVAAGFHEEEVSEFTRYELTVAADGGWPIQLDVERRVTLAAALRTYGLPFDDLLDPGAPAVLYERLLLTRIDDPALRVELPLLAG
ncbi:MAG: hypothetical protein KQH83_10195 [Actinobacteria bacterium]|nr:hypothetical protein [Actinomycetota bacterium]